MTASIWVDLSSDSNMASAIYVYWNLPVSSRIATNIATQAVVVMWAVAWRRWDYVAPVCRHYRLLAPSLEMSPPRRHRLASRVRSHSGSRL